MSKTRFIPHATALLLAAWLSVAALASCSEADGTVEEYPDWQARNEAYFNHLSDSVAALLKAVPARTDWKRIKCWSKPDTIAGTNADYIIARVLESGDTATATPLYTDSVKVHYRGHLLPSTSYPQGYEFDYSYRQPFDAAVSVPSKFAVKGVVDGFATALQKMHRGDHWLVYIPYQLGYGTAAYSSIPGYSTLIFDIRMVDIWH